MDFFTSPEDLRGWIKTQKSPDEAAHKIMEIIGKEEEQDIVDTCRSIFQGEDQTASRILFDVLAKYNITSIKEGNMKDTKLKKEAQIYRGEAPLYQDMPMRVCPKLPRSVGRVVNTIHCRDRCIDSISLDDDPKRVYCAEALWRRNVMDKFSREFKNKEGKWVGGYINDRFQVFHDDGGNQMELANKERTRKPRPHQYSTERRLSEGRGEKTYDLTASSKKMVKLASVENYVSDDKIYKVFSDIVEMHEAGLTSEDIIYKVAEHYNESIINVAVIHKVAMKQLLRHNGVVYSHNNSQKVQKTAQQIPGLTTMVSKKDIQIVSLADGQPKTLKIETPVVMVSNNQESPIFQIVDGPDAGDQFKLSQQLDINDSFGILEDVAQGMIQDGAEEIGLNEQVPSNEIAETTEQGKEFPIVEV